MTKDELLACAKAHQSIYITYVNETTNDGQILTRLVDIYVIGYTRKGNLAFRGYQRGGASHTDSYGWKIFLLKNVKDWQLRDSMPKNAPADYRAVGDDDLAVIYQQPNPIPDEQTQTSKAGNGILYPLLDLINKLRKKYGKKK